VGITLDEDGADIYDIGIGQLTDAPALADPDPINGDGEPADGGDPSDPPTGTGESVVV
jgi:hypothetical protein